MTRVGFCVQLKPDRLDEYRERHKHVWPDMLQALSDNGWKNYTLFLRPDGLLFGYAEVESFEAALAGMEATEVNARWQAEMAQFVETKDDRRLDQSFLSLQEIFHLD